MKLQISILTFIILTVVNLNGQTKNYFPNLTTINVDNFNHARFSFESNTTRLINTVCFKLNKTDLFYCSDSNTIEGTIVAKYKNQNLKDSLTILFDAGMSNDPEYTVLSKTQKVMGRFSALDFYINSSGTIYTAGHINNMYNRKRKFQIQKDTIIEIKQPYNYVGLKGKTLKEIILYKDKAGSDIIVARLPKDYEIEILLTESNTTDYQTDLFYLVKTEFGLIGWLRLTQEDAYGGILKDLYYNGD